MDYSAMLQLIFNSINSEPVARAPTGGLFRSCLRHAPHSRFAARSFMPDAMLRRTRNYGGFTLNAGQAAGMTGQEFVQWPHTCRIIAPDDNGK